MPKQWPQMMEKISFIPYSNSLFSAKPLKQNAKSLLTQVSDSNAYAAHMVACILVSMAARITAYFKDSDWLLKNFYLSENG